MIEIKNFHKKFNAGTVNEVYALRGVNLSVEKGQFVTIIGTNGSGKSTLLNAVAGSFFPDEGDVLIDGNDVTNMKENERAKYISRVFQNPFMGTAPRMTIAENLHMAALRGSKRGIGIGLNSSRNEKYAEEVRKLEMNLEDRLHNEIGSLSGGQRQALTLLMAVITKPKALLLDEHTAALDPKSAAQVIKLTREFVESEGLTAIMVTHSMRQALDLGDRTIMMNRGEIIDDIAFEEKKRLTPEDLLDKFADIRKREKLTEDMMLSLTREYM